MAIYHNEQTKALFLSAYEEKLNFLDALERNITAYKDKWYNQPKWRPADHPRLEDANELQRFIDNARGDTESLTKALVDEIEEYLNEIGFSKAKLSPLRLSLKSTLKKFQKKHPLSVVDGNLLLVKGYDPEEDATLDEDDTASHELHEAEERIQQLELELAAARGEREGRAAPVAQVLAAAPGEAEERAAQLEQELAAARLAVVNKDAELVRARAECERLREELTGVTEDRDNANRNHEIAIGALREANHQLSAQSQASQDQAEALNSLLNEVQQELEKIGQVHSVTDRRLGKGREVVKEYDHSLQSSHAKLMHIVETIIKRFIVVGKDTLHFFNGRNAEIKRQNKELINDIGGLVELAESEIAPEKLIMAPPRDDNSFFMLESPEHQHAALPLPPSPPRREGEPSKYALSDEKVLQIQSQQFTLLAASLSKRRGAIISPPSTPAKTPMHSEPAERSNKNATVTLDPTVSPETVVVPRVLDLEKPPSDPQPGQATKAAHTRQFAPASRVVGLTNMAQGRAAGDQQILSSAGSSTEAIEIATPTEVGEEDSFGLN
jgi:hypothetical protein